MLQLYSLIEMPIAPTRLVLLLQTVLLAFGACDASAHERITRSTNGRDYQAYLPDDHASRTEPMQVLMALHPASFDGAGFQNMSRFEAEAGAADVIVIYPDGSPGALGLSWEAADPRGLSRGDMEYLLAVIEDIATVVPTKPKVAVTGFSAGALMTYRMLCDHGELISAAVPYGAYFNDNVVTNGTWPATVPVMHMHGTDDSRVNPITGEGDADTLYNFGILADHMVAVAARNHGELAFTPDFSSVETSLSEAEVVVVNDATSYVLLDGVSHYWPRFLNGNGPNGSAAVLAFINQFADPPISQGAYAAWLATHPTLTGDDALRDADPDGDRLPNLIECIMGFDPQRSELGEASYPTSTATDGGLRIVFRIAPGFLPSAGSGISFFGERNTDLGDGWTRVEPVPLGGELFKVEVEIGNNPVGFLRLAAEDHQVE